MQKYYGRQDYSTEIAAAPSLSDGVLPLTILVHRIEITSPTNRQTVLKHTDL